jgi:hypothetical protein
MAINKKFIPLPGKTIRYDESKKFRFVLLDSTSNKKPDNY